MSEFKSLLESVVEEQVPAKEVALLLSGGVDSLSLGFAAQALGKRVTAYTFQVGEWRSVDAASSERACKIMGWKRVLVKVPVDNVADDFLALASKHGCVKKTQFECTWPFLYVVPVIREKHVLSGIAADGHFGLSKKAILHWRFPREKFDEFRRAYFSSPNPAGQVQQKKLIEDAGKIQSAPYLDRRVFDFFMLYDWNDINTPRQKQITLGAYPEWFRLCGARKHMNLQLVAGVPTIFESLLKSKLNTKGRTRVMDLCRDYSAKGGEA